MLNYGGGRSDLSFVVIGDRGEKAMVSVQRPVHKTAPIWTNLSSMKKCNFKKKALSREIKQKVLQLYARIFYECAGVLLSGWL